MKASLVPILCLAALAVVSCARKNEEEVKAPVAGPTLVGRIASIPSGEKFVLIQSYGNWQVPVGSVLTTRGPDERTANLLATGEALGQYAAADIRAGTVEVGDAVFLQPPPSQTPAAEPAPPTLPEAATPAEASPGDLQRIN